MSVEMPAGVMVADMVEGMKFALGAAMAVRRDAIEAIGGMRETADFYSDDFVLGNLVAAAGFEVVLSHYKVGHVLAASSLRRTFGDQLRWMKSTRFSRPWGHVGSGLTYAMPFGLLALLLGLGHRSLYLRYRAVGRWRGSTARCCRPLWAGESCAIRAACGFAGCIRCATCWDSAPGWSALPATDSSGAAKRTNLARTAGLLRLYRSLEFLRERVPQAHD